jgi:hypothetical protein
MHWHGLLAINAWSGVCFVCMFLCIYSVFYFSDPKNLEFLGLLTTSPPPLTWVSQLPATTTNVVPSHSAPSRVIGQHNAYVGCLVHFTSDRYITAVRCLASVPPPLMLGVTMDGNVQVESRLMLLFPCAAPRQQLPQGAPTHNGGAGLDLVSPAGAWPNSYHPLLPAPRQG